MSKGQKVITHHTVPVVTAQQIGKQYNLSGKEYKQARERLEALAYIKPVRFGSHTYELLKGDIPETLDLLDREYITRFHSYVLAPAYQQALEEIAEFSEYVRKQSSKNWSDQYIMERMRSTQHLLASASQTLPAAIPDINHHFVCLPIHAGELGRQKRLENTINLLTCIVSELEWLQAERLMPLDYSHLNILAATLMLANVKFPQIWEVRPETQP